MADHEHIDILADRVDRLACAKCGHHMNLIGLTPFSEILCPQCNAKQVVPLRLGSFLLLKELGKGGMGAVYRAFDQTLGRYVAIKVMQRSLADDKTFAENFLREARAAAALNHPHVAQVYACGQEKGQLYIVMELVDGGRLDEMIADGKSLDEVRTLEIAVQVAQGLQAASEIGMVHGDIKPANILFDQQNRAKVVDFGLARFANKQHQPGEIWGTPFYIAPEKVRSQPEDLRSDIYSLGATLYHVLGGKPPYDGDTAKDVVVARLKGPAIPLRVVRPSIQPETAAMIGRMLEAEPSMRYPTYKSLLADMEEALRAARQNRGLSASPESTSRAPVIIGLLIALVLIGGLVALFSGNKEEDDPSVLMPGISAVDSNLNREVPPPKPVTPEVVYFVQPFTGSVETNLIHALDLWSTENSSAMEDGISALYNTVARTGLERPWLGVLQALPAWTERREADVTRYLRGIQDAQLRELEEGQVHPGVMPQGLARFMMGRLTEDELKAIASAWPDWFGHLSEVFIAVRHLREGELPAAESALAQYLESKPDDSARWPYALKPIATQWMESIKAWKKVRTQAQSDEPKKAEGQLRAYREKTPFFLHKLIDVELKATQVRLKAEEDKKQAEILAAQQAKVKEDMERIEGIRAEMLPLLAKREFRRAAIGARAETSQIETEEGKEALGYLVEAYERMESLRRFLIKGIQKNPFPQSVAPELGGDALGATLAGIRISLGGYGAMVRNWEQINERTFVSLADYYLANMQLSDEERADMTLSEAVFCYYHRGLRLAQTYAEQAIALDATLAEPARNMMPDAMK